jgi:hypothetical protein
MEKPVNNQNLDRYRHLLTRVTDEEQRNQIRGLMAKEAAKDVPATGRDDTYVRTNDAISPGVIWA